jgi:hypothetical protein
MDKFLTEMFQSIGYVINQVHIKGTVSRNSVSTETIDV